MFHFILLFIIPLTCLAESGVDNHFELLPIQSSLHLISGKWVESEIDLQIGGEKPLELKRTFHTEPRDLSPFAIGWSFNLPDFGKEDCPRQRLIAPSKRRFHYEYDSLSRLKKIEILKESTQEALGGFEIDYAKEKCTVTSHLGDQVIYGLIQKDNFLLLDFVEKPGMKCTYTYIPHPIERTYLIETRNDSHGNRLKFSYYAGKSAQDFKAGKIKEVSSSLDDGATYTSLYRLDYTPYLTELLDAQNVLTKYYYNDAEEIQKIETFLPEIDGSHLLYRTLELKWDKDKLIQKAIYDAKGAKLIEQKWVYEQKKLIEESLSGTLTERGKFNESFKKTYRYDSMNRLIEEIEDDYTLFYTYQGDNHLPTSVELKENEIIIERTFFLYDEEDRLICIEKEAGSTRTFEKRAYDTAGHLLSDINSAWDSVKEKEVILQENHYIYDERGCLTNESTQDQWKTFTYNSHGALQEVIDSNGSITQYFPNEKRAHYDGKETITTFTSQNQVLKEESFQNGRKLGSLRYHYDAFGHQIGKTENESYTTTYRLDSLNRKIEETLPEVLDQNEIAVQHGFQYSYDVLDRVVESISSEGHQQTTLYNARGQPLLITYPGGSQEEKQYTLKGLLKKEVFRNGTYNIYEYDAKERIRKKAFYDKNDKQLSEYQYIYVGNQLVEEIHSTGIHLKHSYDGLGRTIASECLATGRRSTYDFETLTQKQWHGENEMDYLELPLKKALQDKNQEEELLFEFVQNDLGQTVMQKIIFHDGITFLYRYDALNRLEQVKKLAPDRTCLLRKTIRYNCQGAKIKECFHLPDGKIIKNAWDYTHDGQIKAFIEAQDSINEKKTLYHYFPCGQLEAEEFASGVTLYYAYNEAGKLARLFASDHSIDYSLTYNHSLQISKIYDHINALESERFYNLDGQLTEEKLANGLLLQNTYDLLGRRIALQLPDYSFIEYDFDKELVQKITRKNKNGEPLYSHQYTAYDDQGRIKSAEMILGLGTINYSYHSNGRQEIIKAPLFNQTASFNEKGQLIGLKTEDVKGCYENIYAYSNQGLANESGNICLEYEYDFFENRNDAYQANSLNQIFSIDESLEYDSVGNLIKRGDFYFSYDVFNRLIEVKKQGKILHQYIYDLFHRRLIDKATSTYFIYDGNWEMGSIDQETDTQTLRIFEVSKTSEHPLCIAFEQNNQIFAPLYHLSRSVAEIICCQTRQVIESHRYSSFGQLEHSSLFPWTYANKRLDPETGLMHFGRRDYDPILRRFISQDPLCFADGPNRYAYLHNDPLNSRDYFGLQSISETWEGFKKWAFGCLSAVTGRVQSGLNFLKSHANLSYSRVLKHMVGDGFLLLRGYYPTQPESGVFGQGEVSDKVRISYINGILTDHGSFASHLKGLSESHGNVNIHWVYRPTRGWLWDALHSIAVSSGLISEQATLLAESWHALIEEMGGIAEGGKIIHYAHSIGTIETQRALSLLSYEEQQCIHIYAFGSPNLAVENPNYQMHHYVGIHDGISLLNCVAYFQARIGTIPNVTFVGPLVGIPFIDHLFNGQTYQDIWKSMGRTFVDWYGSI